ncbi:helix-turn-helix domain-containing protein [Streptomyces venezuelae]|uniref:helix-turn-helix domain-containing protein n=1 Tax=Streptomyces venezuelae TaxID=54571 RepID=UPI003EBB8EDF
MNEDEQFTELMNKSSLGAPGVQRTLARVPRERADAIRRMNDLRNKVSHGSRQEQIPAAAELVGLMESLGFSWRGEVPEAVVHAALIHCAALLETNQQLQERIAVLERRSWEQTSRQTAPAESAPGTRRPPHSVLNAAAVESAPVAAAAESPVKPESRVRHWRTRWAKPSTSDGRDRFMDVAEAAAELGVSKMTVYVLIHHGELPAVRKRKKFFIPASAVADYQRELASAEREA